MQTYCKYNSQRLSCAHFNFSTKSIPLKYHAFIRVFHLKIDFMIHTKELRFGNKVKTRQGEVITVQQILSNTLIYDSKIEVNRELINVKGSYMTDYLTQLNEVVKEVDCHDIEPITLSQDILRKCGFRNFLREQWIFSIGNSHTDWEFVDERLRLRSPGAAMTSIRYLHQLQNFLYAIATYELEVAL